MANAISGRTFHESWHKIAQQKISLRHSVRVRKQYFRGEKWYVIFDPFNNNFFRLRPESYEFIARLRPNRTVEEVWQECLDRKPETAPGQKDVIQLLAQLYFANLLYSTLPVDSQKLFERYKVRKQRELKSQLRNIMFVRIPLFDPENLLNRFKPFIRFFVNPIGVFTWFAVAALALKVAIDHSGELSSQLEGVLAPGNLIYLYLSIILVKILHEFGHAIICKHYDGEVHTMGVMLLIFTPLPYMDATSSWSLHNRWKRIWISSAGMITELFIAGLATMVWALSASPGIVHSVAFNVMLLASVSTLLFNANPLLRFDGYYILADLIDIPNLSSRSKEQLIHFFEKYLLGVKESISPADTLKEVVWLTAYGFFSFAYRLIILTAIIVFVSDSYLIFGLLLACFCLISWGVFPVLRFVAYIMTSPQLQRVRGRSVLVSFGGILTLLALLWFVPMADHFRAPGILESQHHVKVVNDTAGYVRTIFVPTGAMVQTGTPLLELSNSELDIELRVAKAQYQETQALQMQVSHQDAAGLETIQKRLLNIEEKISKLEKQQQFLVVRARQNGMWVSPTVKNLWGAWLDRGTEIGTIIDESSFIFSAVVSQNEASHLFSDEIQGAEVRLYGQGEFSLQVQSYEFIPFKFDRLPSAVLGWAAGGQIPTVSSDETGTKTVEPFFKISALLAPDSAVQLSHGGSGQIRFALHPRPLLKQWIRKFRQFLQKRYKV